MFVTIPRPVPAIAASDLRWLAGLLEGEGTFIAGPPSAPRSSDRAGIDGRPRTSVARVAALLDCSVTRRPGAAGRLAHGATPLESGAACGRVDAAPASADGCAPPRSRSSARSRAIAPDPNRHLDDDRATRRHSSAPRPWRLGQQVAAALRYQHRGASTTFAWADPQARDAAGRRVACPHGKLAADRGRGSRARRAGAGAVRCQQAQDARHAAARRLAAHQRQRDHLRRRASSGSAACGRPSRRSTCGATRASRSTAPPTARTGRATPRSPGASRRSTTTRSSEAVVDGEAPPGPMHLFRARRRPSCRDRPRRRSAGPPA